MYVKMTYKKVLKHQSNSGDPTNKFFDRGVLIP